MGELRKRVGRDSWVFRPTAFRCIFLFFPPQSLDWQGFGVCAPPSKWEVEAPIYSEKWPIKWHFRPFGRVITRPDRVSTRLGAWARFWACDHASGRVITRWATWSCAWPRDHAAWARDHVPDARNHALHAVIFGLMRAYPGVLSGVLGPSGRVFMVRFVRIDFDFHAWANLLGVITRWKLAHALLSGDTRKILDVLPKVLGAYGRVFDVRFTKIDFRFIAKLNPSPMKWRPDWQIARFERRLLRMSDLSFRCFVFHKIGIRLNDLVTGFGLG